MSTPHGNCTAEEWSEVETRFRRAFAELDTEDGGQQRRKKIRRDALRAYARKAR